MKIIEPRLPKGFRDYMPEEEAARQKMFEIIRSVFERFGFLPLDTPAIEHKDTLTGDDSGFDMHIFTAGINDNKEKLALRFDLTVPLARVVAEHQNEIQKPFKRYQIGKVWRGENPQAGRYREFVQCDGDIVGTSSIIADAEIISLIYEMLKALGITNFLIRINNRKLLNALVTYVGFSEKQLPAVLRIIDKLDKQGWGSVQKELKEDVSFSEAQIEKVKKFLEIKSLNKEEALDIINAMLGKESDEGVIELRDCRRYLEVFGVPKDAWEFDFSIARGLGYYTGIVFESILKDLPELGSVMSGGRYDNLVSRFSSQTIPATGVSLGIDRLFAGLKKLGYLDTQKSLSKILILNFDEDSEDACIKALQKIRKENISAEIYLGNERAMKGQLAYALKREIPFVLIIGSDERKKGIAQFKDLQERTQKEIKLSSIGKDIKKHLK